MAYNQVQEKGGRVQKSSNMVTARVPPPQAGEQDARNRWQIRPSYKVSHHNRLYPAFLYWVKKPGFSKIDAALKMPSHQRPANALLLNDVLSMDELLPQPVRAGRAAGGWSQAGCDNYLYILRSGEFYFLLSSPSNRYRSCQNIKSPADKNTLQRRS